MTPYRLAAIRALSDELARLLALDDLDDDELGVKIPLLGGALAGFVPELLDELERLQRGNFGAAHMVKIDRQGGHA